MSGAGPSILYVAALGPGSTAAQRMHALEAHGVTVVPVDTVPWLSRTGNRLTRSLAWRWGLGPVVRRFNRELRQRAEATTYDWVWLDKGHWVYPETLEALRRSTHTRLIHYTPDAHFFANRSPRFPACIPLYDLLITTKSHEIEFYRRYGARELIFQHQGYDHHIFRPYPVTAEDRQRLGSEVCFIGRSERHYLRCLKAAGRATGGLAVWGYYGRAARLRPWLRKVFRGGPILEEQYAMALCCTKIALGLLTKRNGPDQSTTRSFEIPACGAFLLAERTAEHQALFEEDREAVFFSSRAEMCDKIRYYLAHDGQRRRIAAAGLERCRRSGYRWEDRMCEVFRRIRELGWLD
jgi:glycosyltransferase involved in cell wall biosynthesis